MQRESSNLAKLTARQANFNFARYMPGTMLIYHWRFMHCPSIILAALSVHCRFFGSDEPNGVRSMEGASVVLSR